MKEKLTDEIKEIINQTTSWAKLEVEYAKFTIAEKFTMLISAFIISAICLLLLLSVLMMLSLALVQVFRSFMDPALAYLSVAGVICLFVIIIYLARKPLLLNPIAKYLTRLFFTPKK